MCVSGIARSRIAASRWRSSRSRSTVADARALHLDDDLALLRRHGRATLAELGLVERRAQARPVDLADRGGRERLLVEPCEDVVQWRPERGLDLLLDVRDGDRRHVVLELLQLADELGRQQIGPRRGDLTELDERRPELLEHEADALVRGDEPGLTVGVVLQLGRRWGEPAEAHARQKFTEAVLGEDCDDLAETAEVTDGGEDGGHAPRLSTSAPGRSRRRWHIACSFSTA